jgi:hypothetical protein
MTLIVGIVLALGALAYVLYPLFAEPSASGVPRNTRVREQGEAPERESAIDALREVEFDRATGKLSDDDYVSLRARYTAEAVTELRASEAGATGASASPSDAAGVDAAELLISRFRARQVSCDNCGPRPEPDALYCSNCGLFLPGSCGKCGARASEPGAQFCSSCGARLAA